MSAAQWHRRAGVILNINNKAAAWRRSSRQYRVAISNNNHRSALSKAALGNKASGAREMAARWRMKMRGVAASINKQSGGMRRHAATNGWRCGAASS